MIPSTLEKSWAFLIHPRNQEQEREFLFVFLLTSHRVDLADRDSLPVT